jgi:hypothetical protein
LVTGRFGDGSAALDLGVIFGGPIAAQPPNVVEDPVICAGCEQGMTPTPYIATWCGWPGCRHKGVTP